MTKFQVIAMLVLILPVIAVAIILRLLILKRDREGWTRCWCCGEYFNSWGDRCKIPLSGTVKQGGLCKPCLNNEKQVDGYAKRH